MIIRSLAKILTLLALFLVLGAVSPGPCLANGLPVNMSGDFLGPVVPAAETPVGIESERLSIDFTEHSSRFSPLSMRAKVTAAYVLNNPSRDTISVPVLFIGDFAGQANVTLDGREVPVVREITPVSHHYPVLAANAGFAWYDPYTGENYPLPKNGLYRNSYGKLPFTLVLPPGSHQLRVVYESGMGHDGGRYLNRVFHLSYLLQPARHWAYFKELDISVGLPHKGYRVAASLPLERTGPGKWAANFSGLPGEDLHLSIISTRGMWLGRFTTGASVWLLLAAVVILPALYSRFLAVRVPGIYSPGAGIALKAFAAWFSWETLTRGILPLPLNILVQVPVLAFILLYLLKGAVKDWRGYVKSMGKNS